MDHRVVRILEESLEDAIRQTLQQLSPETISAVPDERILHLMAKAAVTVFEAASVRHQRDGGRR